MKTIIDFTIDVAHDSDLRVGFLNAVKTADSSKDIKKWFDGLSNYKYDIADDELIRIYENKERIINNPYAKDPSIKGY